MLYHIIGGPWPAAAVVGARKLFRESQKMERRQATTASRAGPQVTAGTSARSGPGARDPTFNPSFHRRCLA